MIKSRILTLLSILGNLENSYCRAVFFFLAYDSNGFFLFWFSNFLSFSLIFSARFWEFFSRILGGCAFSDFPFCPPDLVDFDWISLREIEGVSLVIWFFRVLSLPNLPLSLLLLRKMLVFGRVTCNARICATACSRDVRVWPQLYSHICTYVNAWKFRP